MRLEVQNEAPRAYFYSFFMRQTTSTKLHGIEIPVSIIPTITGNLSR